MSLLTIVAANIVKVHDSSFSPRLTCHRVEVEVVFYCGCAFCVVFFYSNVNFCFYSWRQSTGPECVIGFLNWSFLTALPATSVCCSLITRWTDPWLSELKEHHLLCNIQHAWLDLFVVFPARITDENNDGSVKKLNNNIIFF